MNKKRLSVVMAGAMLASSVAPVMAAEANTDAAKKYDVSANDLGVLKKELRTFLNGKKFHMADKNPSLAGESVYYFTTDLQGTQYKDVDNNTVIADLKAGQKLYVWSEGFKTDDKGNNFSKEKNETTSKVGKYTLDEMKSTLNWYNNNKALAVMIKGMDLDNANSILKVQLVNGKVLTYTTNDYQVDFVKPTYNGYSIDNVAANAEYVDGFEDKTTSNSDDYKDIANELLAEITITPGGYDLSLDDLYDGLMLTTDGHDFFTLLKEAQSMGRTVNIRGNNTSKPWIKYNGKSYESNVANAIEMKAGKGYFTVEIGPKGQLAAETYTISGTNEDNLERVAKWMIKPQARVDILAGDNRYETAVEIAKEYAELTGETVSNNGLSADIVLVNGNALVDGLVAAPLASALGLNANGTAESAKHRAPVLLTEADALPKATKAYLKEVLANVQIGKLGTVTIHLVGGESVLNKSLEKELKGLGFKVERYGGDNREETSLEVAEAIEGLKGTNSKEAFVVGAEGEADAMSIAAVAANTKTPIIVAKKGGISEDATYELRGKKATIIGGETAVSKADYNAIKAEADGIARIAGSNRQATNAEIIAKYYKNGFVGAAKNVVVAKDGQNNKTELVDALAAANMASEKKAPIVLATKKLSKAQINALELNAKQSYALYQVGHGVSRNVVKTIAENLGLSNR